MFRELKFPISLNYRLMLRKYGILLIAVSLTQVVKTSYVTSMRIQRHKDLMRPYRIRRLYTTEGCYLDPDEYIQHHIYGAQKLGTELQQASHALQGSYTYPYSPFTPVCFRCAICLSIVEQLNQTINLAHEMLYYKKRLENVPETLRSLCRTGFENFELRNLNNFHLVTDITKGTTHIPCYLDGKWKDRLQFICHDYLDWYGEDHFYKTWLDDPDSLVDEICRGGGLLRDCANVPVERVALVSGALSWPWSRPQDLVQHFRTACP